MVYGKLQDTEAKLVPNTYLSYTNEATERLLSGAQIEEAHLGTIQVPNQGDIFGLETQLIADTPANRTWLIGKRLNATIPAGRVLTYDLFEDLDVDRLDSVVAIGKRAFTFKVSKQSSLANRIIPGNRIDILAMIVLGQERSKTVSMLEDVKVIAVGKSLTFDQFQSDARGNYDTITVEILPEQGEQLAADLEDMSGDPIVLLRNQCDTSEPSPSCG